MVVVASSLKPREVLVTAPRAMVHLVLEETDSLTTFVSLDRSTCIEAARLVVWEVICCAAVNVVESFVL